MDHALEITTERLRDYLRRPHAGKRNHLIEHAAYTVNLTDPHVIAVGVSPPGAVIVLRFVDLVGGIGGGKVNHRVRLFHQGIGASVSA
jgi:hypothetical protein